ncbi:hypothetical protein AB0D08_23675 [Kitasatospora sp. NPDC048540]|uniref:hypothetical protein n=1 Tax=Kitasatospora sp. NPDC048540 TaxID=3155634 RepID=UPI0033C2C0BC
MTGPLGSRRARGRVLAAALVAALPLAASCGVEGVQEDDDRPPVVGAWKSPSFGTIQLLEGGRLGEVSLRPAACDSKSSAAATTYTGTWTYGRLDSAGAGVDVTMTAAAGGPPCQVFLEFLTHQGQDRLHLAYAPASDEPFVRQ